MSIFPVPCSELITILDANKCNQAALLAWFFVFVTSHLAPFLTGCITIYICLLPYVNKCKSQHKTWQKAFKPLCTDLVSCVPINCNPHCLRFKASEHEVFVTVCAYINSFVWDTFSCYIHQLFVVCLYKYMVSVGIHFSVDTAIQI